MLVLVDHKNLKEIINHSSTDSAFINSIASTIFDRHNEVIINNIPQAKIMFLKSKY